MDSFFAGVSVALGLVVVVLVSLLVRRRPSEPTPDAPRQVEPGRAEPPRTLPTDHTRGLPDESPTPPSSDNPDDVVDWLERRARERSG